jgi:hypothetical protein
MLACLLFLPDPIPWDHTRSFRERCSSELLLCSKKINGKIYIDIIHWVYVSAFRSIMFNIWWFIHSLSLTGIKQTYTNHFRHHAHQIHCRCRIIVI